MRHMSHIVNSCVDGISNFRCHIFDMRNPHIVCDLNIQCQRRHNRFFLIKTENPCTTFTTPRNTDCWNNSVQCLSSELCLNWNGHEYVFQNCMGMLGYKRNVCKNCNNANEKCFSNLLLSVPTLRVARLSKGC